MSYRLLLPNSGCFRVICSNYSSICCNNRTGLVALRARLLTAPLQTSRRRLSTVSGAPLAKSPCTLDKLQINDTQLWTVSKRNMSFSFTMGNILVKSAVHDLAIQWGLFVVAALLNTEKFFDFAGSGTFLYLAYKSLEWGKTYFQRQKVQSTLVGIWAVRLGYFLVSRILKAGKDGRFDKIKQKPLLFWQVWTLQALWVFITMLPTLLVNSKREDQPLTTRDYLGWGIWGLGFLLEVVADHQKSVFKADPANADKFISSGLWSISRHPNYLGEILLWLGLYISSTSVLQGWELAAGALSPIFITLLLTRVSGIPMLENRALKKWGSDPAYQQYIRNTKVLIPFLW